MEDNALVRQFQQGEHNAFDEIVERYKKRLYFFAYKLVQDHQEAEDLSQETFLRAYNGLDRFRGESSLRCWLFRILVNYYQSYRRKQRVDIAANVEVEEMMQADKTANGALQKETQRLVQTAIEQLPKKQKVVLVLRTFEQLSYDEIADTVGISRDSVKANLSYARKTLREKLQGVMS